MPIISISRGSYNRGKEVAEKVAAALNWRCLSRDKLIDESDEFHDSAVKMVRNIMDATRILDRFAHGKERYVAMIQAKLLGAFSGDNLVYHGLAGFHLLQGISHLLKVRIITDLETRVADEMKRENISAGDARYILTRDDEERRKWSLFLHGIDTWDPGNYDLVINTSALSVDDAVDIVVSTAGLERFQSTEASLAKFRDMALAARAKFELFQYPSAAVSARNGRVRVELKAPGEQKESITSKIHDMIGRISEVQAVDVRISTFY